MLPLLVKWIMPDNELIFYQNIVQKHNIDYKLGQLKLKRHQNDCLMLNRNIPGSIANL